MIITESSVRRLVRESLLIEGLVDDLVSQYPDHAAKIKELKPKFLNWLNARFGNQPKIKEIHPLADTLPTLKLFQDKDAAIGQKFRNFKQFRDDIDRRFPDRKWKFPNDIETMDANDMSLVCRLFDKKKLSLEFRPDPNVEEDKIGKVGPWNLWIPSTRERSIQIAGYDPDTMEPYTSWCTARLGGDNLFYDYVGLSYTEDGPTIADDSPDVVNIESLGNCILFYVIKDNPKNDSDWLSLGFRDSVLVFNGDGTESVDKENKGLNKRLLKQILGASYLQVMKVLQENVNRLGGVSPAKSLVLEATQSVDALEQVLSGLSYSGSNNMLSKLCVLPLSDEVAIYILLRKNTSDESSRAVVRKTSSQKVIDLALKLNPDAFAEAIAQNPRAPKDLRINLARNRLRLDDNSIFVLQDVLSSTDEALSFSRSENLFDRALAAISISSPIEVLTSLSRDSSPDVRYYVTLNPSTTIEIKRALSKDPDARVRKSALGNLRREKLITRDDLAEIDDESQFADSALAFIKQEAGKEIPEDILRRIVSNSSDLDALGYAASVSNDPDTFDSIARNEAFMKSPASYHVYRRSQQFPATFNRLLNHPDKDVRKQTIMFVIDPSAKAEVFSKLVNDPEESIRVQIASSYHTTPEIPLILANDPSAAVRRELAYNVYSPGVKSVLDQLAQDPDPSVSDIAKKSLVDVPGRTLLQQYEPKEPDDEDEDEEDLNEFISRVINRLLT